MNSGARVAIGVAAGYFLGRTRKMRLALMIAAAGVTGARGGSPAVLLKRGLSQLGSVPEVAELAQTAKKELLGAAKAATVAAATKQVTAISGRMQDQIRGSSADEDDEDAEADHAEETDEVDERDEQRERPKRRRRTRAADEDDDAEDEDSVEDSDEDADEPDENPAPRRRGARAGSSSGRSPVRRSGR